MAFKNTTEVYTREGYVSLECRRGCYEVLDFEGATHFLKSSKCHGTRDLREYTIETKARTIKITCSQDTKVRTERGQKQIRYVTPGDVLCIKGYFVHTRHSIVTKVSSKSADMCISQTLSGSECIVNGLVVKC